VRFTAEHDFPGAPAAVARVLLDPEFHATLDLPDVARPTLLASEPDGDGGMLRMRYEFVGRLDPIGRRLLGSRKLAWVQELRLDADATRGTLTFRAEEEHDRLRGDGLITLEAKGDGCVRRISGDFVVRMPLIGGTAERKLLPGIVRRMDLEADAVRARLTSETS
jgi:hypothetical protein